MREIKFRARVDFETVQVTAIDFISDDECIIQFKTKFGIARHAKINPSKLMQFTGLKDKNGVDIYERDIVYIAGAGNMKVVFDYCAWHFENDREMIEFTSVEGSDFGAIVGSINENPELLEAE